MINNKRILSCLLALMLLLGLSFAGAQPAFAEEGAPDAQARVDIQQQLELIRSQMDKLKQKDDKMTWYYTVADLNHDGSLEFIAAAQHPKDRSTNVKIWEVSKDKKALTACKLVLEEDESFPDILTDCADTYYDAESGRWSYMVYDNVVLSDTEVYTVKTAVSFSDAALSYVPYAVEHTVVNNAWRDVSHTDANGLPISPEEYNAAGASAFTKAERSSTNFEWLKQEELEDAIRLTDSYSVFAGEKKPTEVFPVPRPAALQQPTPTPTAAPQPAATPVPTSEPPLFLSVTKNPTNENKKAGGTALFVACANAFDSLTWTIVSPNGGEYAVQSFAAMFPGSSVTGEYSTTLSIANVPQEMNGWGAYCSFYYRGQTARTSTAWMYVSAAPAPTPSPVPAPNEGYVNGAVYDWNYACVGVWTDGGYAVAVDWHLCSITGEVCVGSPVTYYWSGSPDNITICCIQGQEPAPQPEYGSMSGTITDVANAYTIALADGSTVTVSGNVCSQVTGDYVEVGNGCVVYYEGYPDQSGIYLVEIYGSYSEDGSAYETYYCPTCWAEVSLDQEECQNCGQLFG